MGKNGKRRGVVLARLLPGVSGAIRERGLTCFLEGRVEVSGVGPGLAEATVLGSSTYHVKLESRGHRLLFSCGCPYVESEASPCEHVWALLLDLDHEDQIELLDEAELRFLEPAELAEAPALADDDEELPAAGEAWEDEGWEAEDRDDESEAEAAEGRGALDRSLDDDDFLDGLGGGMGRRAAWRGEARQAPRERLESSPWRQLLHLVAPPGGDAWQADRVELWGRRQLLYVVSAPETLRGRGLALTISLQERKKDGAWGKVKQQRIPARELSLLGDPLDRRILAVLAGAQSESYGWYSYPHDPDLQPQHLLRGPLVSVVLPLLAESERLFLLGRDGGPEPLPIQGDFATPWELVLRLEPVEAGAAYRVRGELEREGEQLALPAVDLAVEEGWCFTREALLRLSDPRAFRWLAALRQVAEVVIPEREARPWLAGVVQQPFVPRLELPEELGIQVVPGVALPRFSVLAPPAGSGARHLAAELSFDYGFETVSWGREGAELFEAATLKVVRRDRAAEQAARQRLDELGVRPAPASARSPYELRVGERDLSRVARTLLAEGWWVEAEGRPLRRSGPFQMEVRSGLDWFDLSAAASFEGQRVELPEILAALARGEHWLRLGDGGLGLLPEDWLEQRGLLTQLGKSTGESLRFQKVQVGLLDALVGDQPELAVDEAFERARRELAGFERVEPADPPPTFVGALREYQRLGLGWLGFLRRFGFGGCLADDMGLGKTVQVLALLAGESAAATAGGPALVVAPRSVVFNWAEETARFWPSAKVLVHSGASRSRDAEEFAAFDLVVTSYGLLREDAALLAQVDWGTVILDEAQAIKNSGSQTAQVARRLRARHRLALSGTPIENHLGELWSLFEFLNPGLLGYSAAFQRASAKPDAAERSLLARAMRPFILRRTKAQVLPELPAKTEQTLHCELEPAERRRYDELKHFYQASLKKKVEAIGWAKAKIHVLEALLRLRQAACHPGLLDPKRTSEPSAKLEALLPLLIEALEGGHKVLVFSQFTSLLAILRSRLEAGRTPYLYLDGKTRDRQSLVSRFQTDPKSRLFLISLKAGGLGLNLTAADYVFLLDPWWNPAVEAQAIDRAHRIGQERHVFAYRLVAKDTVEEKILELQAAKRELADSILSEDNSLIREMTREDLELLLG